MTQKLKKADVSACNYVISPHRIKCNTCIESFCEGLHFFFLHWWTMSNIWGHYDLEAWKFDDLTVLCAVWFTLSVLRDLFLKPWADQDLLTFKVNVKVKLEFLTVACNSSILVIILFFRTRNWRRKSPKLHHIQPPNSTHIWTLIRRSAVRVSVLIRITVLDLEPNPCFQIFLNISKIKWSDLQLQYL